MVDPAEDGDELAAHEKRDREAAKISAHKVLTVIGSAVRCAAHSDGLTSV
jgi:hypothetical protein